MQILAICTVCKLRWNKGVHGEPKYLPEAVNASEVTSQLGQIPTLFIVLELCSRRRLVELTRWQMPYQDTDKTYFDDFQPASHEAAKAFFSLFGS